MGGCFLACSLTPPSDCLPCWIGSSLLLHSPKEICNVGAPAISMGTSSGNGSEGVWSVEGTSTGTGMAHRDHGTRTLPAQFQHHPARFQKLKMLWTLANISFTEEPRARPSHRVRTGDCALMSLTNAPERHPESAGWWSQGALPTQPTSSPTAPQLCPPFCTWLLSRTFLSNPLFFPETLSSSHRITRSQPVPISCYLKIQPREVSGGCPQLPQRSFCRFHRNTRRPLTPVSAASPAGGLPSGRGVRGDGEEGGAQL